METYSENLSAKELSELQNMQEAYKKFCKIDSDQLSNYEIWQRNFANDWGDLDAFVEKLSDLSNKKNSEKRRKNMVDTLPQKVKNAVKKLLSDEDLYYDKIISFMKKHKIVRKYHDTILINKKSGERGTTNHIEESKNLILAKTIATIFKKTIQVVETNNSKRTGRKTSPQEHSRTYKIIPV